VLWIACALVFTAGQCARAVILGGRLVQPSACMCRDLFTARAKLPWLFLRASDLSPLHTSSHGEHFARASRPRSSFLSFIVTWYPSVSLLIASPARAFPAAALPCISLPRLLTVPAPSQPSTRLDSFEASRTAGDSSASISRDYLYYLPLPLVCLPPCDPAVAVVRPR
jgi:hypothetical protein